MTAPAPSTSEPRGRVLPGWSKAQTIVLLRAATCAGWNDRQRYIAMAHAGCPLDAPGGRPSVKHPRNSNEHFRIVMAIAESHAAMNHALADFPLPAQPTSEGAGGGVRTWRSVAANGAAAQRRLCEAIWTEACQRLPEIFQPPMLRAFIARQTKNDPPEITLGRTPEWLADLDEGQLYRVLEGLRAWVGREFLKRDIAPKAFSIPRHIHRQLERSSTGQ